MVTVRILQDIGVKKFIEYAELFGFNRAKLPPYLSIALGTAQFTPLEIASGYCVFANGGSRVTPQLIKTIKDYQGNVIYDAPLAKPIPAINPQVSFLITTALQDAIQRGTGIRAKSLGRKDLAGKTGTTNEWMDAWYSGYNRDIVATAWVGFDESRGLKEYGSMAALPMWMYFMEAVLKDKPEHPVDVPEGIVEAKIDPYSGQLASGYNPDAITEYFAEDNLPGHQVAPSYYGNESQESSSGTFESLF
jgi:penicillin-binding protein 1A